MSIESESELKPSDVTDHLPLYRVPTSQVKISDGDNNTIVLELVLSTHLSGTVFPGVASEVSNPNWIQIPPSRLMLRDTCDRQNRSLEGPNSIPCSGMNPMCSSPVERLRAEI